MNYQDFLKSLFLFSQENNIPVCSARPIETIEQARDIDLIIEVENISKITDWIKQNDKLKITSCFKRTDGMTIHVYGVDTVHAKAVGIDFITSLELKGIPYLETKNVLRRVTRHNGSYHPDDVDQA